MKSPDRSRWWLVLGLAACAACATEPAGVPLCGPLAELPPLPAAGSCDAHELAEFSAALADRIVPRGNRALVRVAFDDAARVRSVCVERGVGTAAWSARRRIAGQLDAVLAHAPGPACVANRRVDLNRYEAVRAEIENVRNRCLEQTRVTRRTLPGVGRAPIAGDDRELHRCLDYHADWIALDGPGTTRPYLFVVPEVADPPELDAIETGLRCARTTLRFEEEAACIRADGFEMLAPPAR